MRILITAGPTREYLDPVRYLSNSSTGFFGYEIAAEAVRRGHKVILISGPTSLKPPKGARFIPVISAIEMKRTVEKFFPKSACLIMSAAVADYRPAKIASRKIKKEEGRITIELIRNPDILLETAEKKCGRIVIGFALETNDLYGNAKGKLINKNLDYIVATSIKNKFLPFGDKKLQVMIMDVRGNIETLRLPKRHIAKIILDKAEAAKYPYNRNKCTQKRG